MNVAQIIRNIETHLELVIPKHNFSEVYRYGVLPPGKAFRPQLVSAIYADYCNESDHKFLEDPKTPVNYLASAVEVHHAYTLLHDDLPSMDDDDTRRGKPATHIKFNEWKALLAGDGLQTASFALLAKYGHKNLGLILKFFSWALGPKGLIQGQYLDLSEEMTKGIDELILTHQYKTARLIQTSILLGYWSSSATTDYRTSKQLFRLGHSVGVVFQLLDDLTELVDEQLSQHELAVNPWLTANKDLCFKEIISDLEKIENIITSEELASTKKVLANYFKKIEGLLVEGKTNITKHSEIDLVPVISLLNRINR
ncbi:geranyltranstransferase [Halobacteriovorax marinus SJ]|uniref:Geranyltranstransferase n=1 Tax=Halobacteriovorax marinus (strain ATCC BAA-682 / DSM 15412 / SJ) TaxID=862908 RepID=E1WZ36_HALMS|nr:polyprenyl synthetase family protein [Halobacteriovorax marinus]CBW26133.1 geranyltranstransferase [Halobacteriovorax marinus SJ]